MNHFIDAGAYLGLLDADDQHHVDAVEGLKTLEAGRLITSSFVLDEVATRGTSLVGATATARFVRGVWESKAVHVVEVGRDLFLDGLAILEKYEDQGLSLTDAVSVAILRAGRIRTIFTFDRAFHHIGFRVIP